MANNRRIKRASQKTISLMDLDSDGAAIDKYIKKAVRWLQSPAGRKAVNETIKRTEKHLRELEESQRPKRATLNLRMTI